MHQTWLPLFVQTAKSTPRNKSPKSLQPIVAAEAAKTFRHGALVENHGDGHQRRNRPPEYKSKFQNRPRKVQLCAQPGQCAPDQGRTENAEQPTGGGDDPQEHATVGSLRRFLYAQPDSQLRARRQISRNRDWYVAESVEQFPR